MDAYLMTNEAFLNRTWLVFFSIHRVFYKLQYVNAIALLVHFLLVLFKSLSRNDFILIVRVCILHVCLNIAVNVHHIVVCLSFVQTNSSLFVVCADKYTL